MLTYKHHVVVEGRAVYGIINPFDCNKAHDMYFLYQGQLG